MIFPLVSNKRIKSSIEALISSSRLPHAIIIEGDLGTGKRTLAKFLAKASVCDEAERPCGACRNCHLAEIGSHPDIEVVSPEEKKVSITKDQIEALRTIAYHSAHTAKRRVFIIEQANTMNPASQNKLLKVLEEPPSDVVFILITPSAEALLETVVSRCLVLSLFTPTFEEALEYLTVVTQDELNTIATMALKVNQFLKNYFKKINVDLVDFKLEFGKTSDGTIVLADEISPDTCRFWDATTHEKLDKDRFRRDMGGVEDAYKEMMKRVLGE